VVHINGVNTLVESAYAAPWRYISPNNNPPRRYLVCPRPATLAQVVKPTVVAIRTNNIAVPVLFGALVKIVTQDSVTGDTLIMRFRLIPIRLTFADFFPKLRDRTLFGWQQSQITNIEHAPL
jgi:hypothetical protein